MTISLKAAFVKTYRLMIDG